MYITANKLGISLDRFPAHVAELKDRIDALRNEIDQIDVKKQQALKDCDMTLELLQEYNANKPFILRLQKYKQQLAEEVEKRRKLDEELEYANSRNARDEVVHGQSLKMSSIRSEQSLSLNLNLVLLKI